jgi:hypothetical protein
MERGRADLASGSYRREAHTQITVPQGALHEWERVLADLASGTSRLGTDARIAIRQGALHEWESARVARSPSDTHSIPAHLRVAVCQPTRSNPERVLTK